MSTYDTREATHILANAVAKRFSQDFESKRHAAAAALQAEVIELAKSAGLHVSKDKDADLIIPNRAASNQIWLVADGDGVHVGFSHMGASQRLSEPEIEYEAAADCWVSKKAETFLTQNPGEPIARRSAAAEVVECVIFAMTKIP
jgi:hypothetical protein